MAAYGSDFSVEVPKEQETRVILVALYVRGAPRIELVVEHVPSFRQVVIVWSVACNDYETKLSKGDRKAKQSL